MLTFALQFAQILPHLTPFCVAKGMLIQPPPIGKGAYVDHHSCIRPNSLFPTTFPVMQEVCFFFKVALLQRASTNPKPLVIVLPPITIASLWIAILHPWCGVVF